MENTDLGYYWEALFEDESVITQYDKDDKETLFKEVLEHKSKLIKFGVISNDEDEEYIVDLKDSLIIGPNVSYEVKGKNPSLIYFRRNFVRQNVGATELLPTMVEHHLGIKTDTEEKKLEIFKGLGQKPKKVELTDIKLNVKDDVTSMILEKE